MTKIMLNYRPNGRRRLGGPLKRLLDEAETGLSGPNWWRVVMMKPVCFLKQLSVTNKQRPVCRLCSSIV